MKEEKKFMEAMKKTQKPSEIAQGILNAELEGKLGKKDTDVVSKKPEAPSKIAERILKKELQGRIGKKDVIEDDIEESR